jgi:signal transduction histidine kinase
VLHFSRAERGAGGGGFGGVREPTAVDEYLQGVIASFAPLAVVRGAIIEARLEPGLVAPLHRESFRQVMLNLLDNAVKYGPKGQTIRVTSEGAGERIRIVVEDQGPGVEPREREAIFEPFRRGERAIGSVAVGSGIGLSVARDLVASHEGRIRAEAAPTGGARFVVELPGWREPARATAHGAAGAGTA